MIKTALGGAVLLAILLGVAVLYALLAIPLRLVVRLVWRVVPALCIGALLIYTLPRLCERLGSLF